LPKKPSSAVLLSHRVRGWSSGLCARTRVTSP
jgi:hypothetical protein